jgi:hypothetical protein
VSAVPEPRTKRRDRVRAVIAELKVKSLLPTHPAVDRMLRTYRLKFGLGPRDPNTERAHRWFGITYRRRVVAVFGEALHGRQLELTDAYFEGRAGRIAFIVRYWGYLAQVERGDIDGLTYSILGGNVPSWLAVIRETRKFPAVLTFHHERGPDGKYR